MKDLKESLSTHRKADITHVRKHFMNYVARPGEYGSVKYERANFLRPTGGVAHDVPTGDDFERLRAYARAAMSHIGDMLQAMELHQATDPKLVDVEGMKRAAYAIDLDMAPGLKVGASKLPHIAPAATSLMMAIEQAVACGLLPADPGRPWEDEATYTSYARVQVKRAPTCFPSWDCSPAPAVEPVRADAVDAVSHAMEHIRKEAKTLADFKSTPEPKRYTGRRPDGPGAAPSFESGLETLIFRNPEPLPPSDTGMRGRTTPGELVVSLHTDPTPERRTLLSLSQDDVNALADGTAIEVRWLGAKEWAPYTKGSQDNGAIPVARDADAMFQGRLTTVREDGLAVRTVVS